MKEKRFNRLLVFAECGDMPELLSELPALQELAATVDLVAADSGDEHFTFLPAALRSSVMARSMVSEAVRTEPRQCDAVIVYGGGVASRAACKTAARLSCPVVVRRCWKSGQVYPKLVDVGALFVNSTAGTDGLPLAKAHSVSSKEVAVISDGDDALTVGLMKALAVGRPSTRFELRCITTSHVPAEAVPSNLNMTTCANLEEALNAGPTDWFASLSVDASVLSPDSVKALSAGVPLIVMACKAADEELTDDCAVIFGLNPQPEEFVRGMLPFLDSDFRCGELRKGARRLWEKQFDRAVASASLANKLSRLLNQAGDVC